MNDLFEFANSIEGLDIIDLLPMHHLRCEERKTVEPGSAEYVRLTREIAAIDREIISAKHRWDGHDGPYIESADHAETGY